MSKTYFIIIQSEGRTMNERRCYKHKERCWRERIERSTNNKWNKVELRQRVLFKVFTVGRWVAPPQPARDNVSGQIVDYGLIYETVGWLEGVPYSVKYDPSITIYMYPYIYLSIYLYNTLSRFSSPLFILYLLIRSDFENLCIYD